MRKSVKMALATSALAVVGGLFLVGSSFAERGPGFGPGGMGPGRYGHDGRSAGDAEGRRHEQRRRALAGRDQRGGQRPLRRVRRRQERQPVAHRVRGAVGGDHQADGGARLPVPRSERRRGGGQIRDRRSLRQSRQPSRPERRRHALARPTSRMPSWVTAITARAAGGVTAPAATTAARAISDAGQ